uniref:C2H2-type domain-containing protein n=1 Tax=Caenorhabditis japonica TaxID=281687 RepID=A0A8R1ETY7_CAEJA
MTPHYERFIIGSAYENRKRHHRCTFPKPNGQQCGYFSSHMDVLNHLAIFHLQHSRFSCNVCEDRFLLQIQFETHRKTDRCPAVIDDSD